MICSSCRLSRPPIDTIDRCCRAVGLLGILGVSTLTVSGGAHGQSLRFSGYYENTLQIDYTAASREQLLNASKLRLDLSTSLTGGFEFRGNVNIIVNVGALQRDLTAYLPESVASYLHSIGAPVIYSLDRTRTFLDNAYISWSDGGVRMRIGRQQLSWGPAYSFNPTDLFHRKNLLDPTYEKEGVAALRLDYSWGSAGQASVIAAPGEDIEGSGYAVRLATHVTAIGYDVAITGHYVTDSTGIDPANLMSLRQRRWAAGLELSGELLGLGTWLEGNYNWMETEADFARFVLGLDYTLDDGTYLMAEWLYNGRAEALPPYSVRRWLSNLYFGEPLGSGWILTGIRRNVSDLAVGSAYAFVSPDGSVMLNPRFDVSVGQNTDLVALGGVTLGRDDGAFTSGLVSLLVRMTVYF